MSPASWKAFARALLCFARQRYLRTMQLRHDRLLQRLGIFDSDYFEKGMRFHGTRTDATFRAFRVHLPASVAFLHPLIDTSALPEDIRDSLQGGDVRPLLKHHCNETVRFRVPLAA